MASLGADRPPRWPQVARLRFVALYVGLFAGSALVLGVAVFLEARFTLQQQMDTRIQTEAAFRREEFQGNGLGHLIEAVRMRGRGAERDVRG